MVYHLLRDLCDAASTGNVPHALSFAKYDLHGPGAHDEADNFAVAGNSNLGMYTRHPMRAMRQVAFLESDAVDSAGHKPDDVDENGLTYRFRNYAGHIKTKEQAQQLAETLLRESKEREHDADEDASDPVALMRRRVDALEGQVKKTKEFAMREAENGIGSSDPPKQAENPESKEDLRGFFDSEGGTKMPQQQAVEAPRPENNAEEHPPPDGSPSDTKLLKQRTVEKPRPEENAEEHPPADGRPSDKSDSAVPAERDHAPTLRESKSSGAASAEPNPKKEAAVDQSKHEETSAKSKHVKDEKKSGSSGSGFLPGGGEVAECDSADGNWKVVVTPDGVRRLYDTHDPGMIQTRIQCDGEAPRGKGQDCGTVHWPCENIHTPFRGYIREITDSVVPFCKVPGWHALIVGLGGGFMQTSLEQQCSHDARIDTIESNPSVVPVAKNALGFDGQSAVQHIQFGRGLQAAKDHLNAGDKYDFIFTDETSENSREFLETAQQLLKPTGRFGIAKVGSRPTFSKDWLQMFHDYFSPSEVREAKEGNHIIVTTPLPVGSKPKDVMAGQGLHHDEEPHASESAHVPSGEKQTPLPEEESHVSAQEASDTKPKVVIEAPRESKPEAQMQNIEAKDTHVNTKQVVPETPGADVQANASSEIKEASTVPSPQASSPASVGASDGTKPAMASMSGSTEEVRE